MHCVICFKITFIEGFKGLFFVAENKTVRKANIFWKKNLLLIIEISHQLFWKNGIFKFSAKNAKNRTF